MIKKHTLKNGLRIMTEKLDFVKSVSMGIWVKVGSVNETDETNGMSHFIEHMLFKGTENRSASEIAEETDSIGGQLNAFTSKDCTCFYIRVLDENITEAVDILSDMFFNSKFHEYDLEKEKSVILEEIKMYEDSPEDLVHDKISEILFKDSSLALPILGTSSNIVTYNRDKIINYKNKHYTPHKTVISVAGNFDEENLLKLLKDKFSIWNSKENDLLNYDKPYKREIKGINKDLEQLHLCIANRTVSRNDELYYPLLVMSNLFGGSMSSRLFQEVREQQGLVYSIYSFSSNYHHTGMFGIYVGLAYENLEKALSTILVEMRKMKDGKITEKEFKRAKQQLKSNYMLGLESTSNIMSSIGRRELVYNKVKTPSQIVEEINNVKIEDIIKISKNIFNKNEFSAVYAGNINKYKDLHDKIENLLS